MAKAYWIAFYQEIKDPEKMAAYAAIGGPAIIEGGGRFVVRGQAAAAYEAGKIERTTVIEFDSLEQAIATHDSPAYQAALEALGDGAVREIRICEGS